MLGLGVWAAANLIYNGAFAGNASGSNKYFYQMNMYWGGINFGLAALGYFGSKNQDGLSCAQSLKKQTAVEKTFLFNAGLDVAYITGGFYLKEKAKNQNDDADRNKGFGKSIILQGSALLLFDAVMYFVHQQHGKKLYGIADKFQIGITGAGIGCVIKL